MNDERQVVKCPHCDLVQFEHRGNCLRCHQAILPTTRVQQHHDNPIELPTPPQGIRALVAENCRRLRLAKHWSQRLLAVQLGSPRTYISKIEIGRTLPNMKQIVRLATALSVPLTVLLAPAVDPRQAQIESDPLTREMAAYVGKLDNSARRRVLVEARWLWQRRAS